MTTPPLQQHEAAEVQKLQKLGGDHQRIIAKYAEILNECDCGEERPRPAPVLSTVTVGSPLF